jgi:sodium transport system permease protein
MERNDWESMRRVMGLPTITDVVLVILLAAVLYLPGAAVFMMLLGEPGLLVAQVLFLGVLPLGYIHLRGLNLRNTFSLRLPDRIQLAGGLLLLVGATVLAWFLAWLQSLVAPVPVEYLDALAEMVTADTVARFLWLLVLVAVVPSIAEEILFRGVVLSGLRTRMAPMAAVVLTGAIFGLFHVAPETGFRVLPTAWLGAVLAWVVVVSRSLPLACLLHFLNNGAILTLMALPASREAVMGSPDAPPPFLLLPLAVGFFVAGVVILRSTTDDQAAYELEPHRSPDHELE